jgi:hypothetical protein
MPCMIAFSTSLGEVEYVGFKWMNVIMPLFHDIGGDFCYNLQEIMLFYAMYDRILNISCEMWNM